MARYSVTLKKRDFGGYIRLIPGAVSNGKWAIRTSVIKNAALFDTKKTAVAFIGDDGTVFDKVKGGTTFESIAPGGKVHAWRATKFLYESGGATARIFRSTTTGEFISIDRRFLEIFNEDNDRTTLYGSSPSNPFMLGETRETAVAIFISFSILDALPIAPPPEKIAPPTTSSVAPGRYKKK